MKSTALLFALLSVAAVAHAADVGQHPAVFSPRTLPAIDAATFIPGHPARGANGESAETVALKAQQRATAAGRPQNASTTQISAAKADLSVATSQQ